MDALLRAPDAALAVAIPHHVVARALSRHIQRFVSTSRRSAASALCVPGPTAALRFISAHAELSVQSSRASAMRKLFTLCAGDGSPRQKRGRPSKASKATAGVEQEPDHDSALRNVSRAVLSKCYGAAIDLIGEMAPAVGPFLASIDATDTESVPRGIPTLRRFENITALALQPREGSTVVLHPLLETAAPLRSLESLDLRWVVDTAPPSPGDALPLPPKLRRVVLRNSASLRLETVAALFLAPRLDLLSLHSHRGGSDAMAQDNWITGDAAALPALPEDRGRSSLSTLRVTRWPSLPDAVVAWLPWPTSVTALSVDCTEPKVASDIARRVAHTDAGLRTLALTMHTRTAVVEIPTETFSREERIAEPSPRKSKGAATPQRPGDLRHWFRVTPVVPVPSALPTKSTLTRLELTSCTLPSPLPLLDLSSLRCIKVNRVDSPGGVAEVIRAAPLLEDVTLALRDGDSIAPWAELRNLHCLRSLTFGTELPEVIQLLSLHVVQRLTYLNIMRCGETPFEIIRRVSRSIEFVQVWCCLGSAEHKAVTSSVHQIAPSCKVRFSW